MRQNRSTHKYHLDLKHFLFLFSLGLKHIHGFQHGSLNVDIVCGILGVIQHLYYQPSLKLGQHLYFRGGFLFFLVFLMPMPLAWLVFYSALSFSPVVGLPWITGTETLPVIPLASFTRPSSYSQSLLSPHFTITRRKAHVWDQEKWLLIFKSNRNLRIFF